MIKQKNLTKKRLLKNYEKRMELIKSGKEPSAEELQEAYGYLDYCINCGKSLTFLDRISFNIQHGCLGNTHKWRGCS